jgi:hypothetical protein
MELSSSECRLYSYSGLQRGGWFSAAIAGLTKAAKMPRYDIDQLPDGWAVIDVATGEPTEREGDLQRGLQIEDAADLARGMNEEETPLGTSRQSVPTNGGDEASADLGQIRRQLDELYALNPVLAKALAPQLDTNPAELGSA